VQKYLAIDVGGTEIKYAVIDSDRNFYQRGIEKTPYKRGLEGFLDTLTAIHDKNQENICGISMSLPGIIDSEKGFCHWGGALEYNISQPLKELLEERCKTTVHMENDGKCAALAEYWCGALKGHTSGMVMILGTGVGGGIIINGQLFKGTHFSAGELSFLSTNAEKWEDLESLASRKCGAVRMIQRVKAAEKIEDDSFDGRSAFELINSGAPEAVAVFRQYTRDIAIQLFNFQMFLDLDVIAIGGGISRQEILVPSIQKSVDEIYETYPMKHPLYDYPKPNVKNCSFLSDSNLIGAVYNFMKMEEKNI